MKTKEEILLEDIKQLGIKLLKESTKQIEPKWATDSNGKKWDEAKAEQRLKIRTIRNLLKERIQTMEVIKESREIKW